MGYLGLVFLSITIVLLSYAAFVAIKLIPIAMWKKPWSAFALGISIYLLFQSHLLYQHLIGSVTSLNTIDNFVDVIISMLIAYIVYQTKPGFKQHRYKEIRREKARNEAELKLEIINKFSSALIKLNNPDDLAWHVASEVVGQLELHDCIIYLYDKEKNCLVQTAAIGIKKNENNEIVDLLEMPLGKGITGWSAEKQEAVIVDDVIKDERYVAELGFAGSEICVPIVNEGKLFGLIDSESPIKGFYNDKHLDLLQTIASMLGFRLAQWDNLEKLNKTKQKLIEAQGIAHFGNWSQNFKTRKLFWSDETFRIFGFEPKSFEPTHSLFLSLVPEDERKYINNFVNHHIKNKTTGNFSIDHPIIWPNGEIKYVNQYGRLNFDDKGRVEAFSGVILDITERKKAEIAAKEAKEQLTDIIKLAPEAIVTFDNALNIVIFNKGAERVFGYKSEEVIGKHLNTLIPKNFHEEHKKHLNNFIFGDEEYRSMDKRSEIQGVRKDGSTFPAMASVSKQQTDNGMAYTVLMRDISEQKQSDKNLRQAMITAENANLAKTAFLAAMSHELRTPLNAIMGFSQIIDVVGFKELGEKKVEEYADHINQSSRSLLQLFNNVLDISKLEAGEYTLTKTELALKPVLEASIKQTMKLADYKNIKLSQMFEDVNISINCDHGALQKILTNSIANAIQFTPKDSNIELSVLSDNKSVKINVTSTGTTISNEELITMKNPMDIELDNPYHAIDGTRLNLLIVKQLTELHEGSLEISSDIGEDTTIKIVLPKA